METAAKPSTLRSILQQRCPRCRIGGSFHYFHLPAIPEDVRALLHLWTQVREEPATFSRYVLQFRDGVLVMAPMRCRCGS